MDLREEIRMKAEELIAKANFELRRMGKPSIPTTAFKFISRRSKTSARARANVIRTAGMIFIENPSLTFNLITAELNHDIFLTQTVPHEVAHLMSFLLGDNGHGWIWGKCCKILGYENPRRLNDLRLAGYIEYGCTCGKTYYETEKTDALVRQNKIFLTCPSCKKELTRKSQEPIDKAVAI